MFCGVTVLGGLLGVIVVSSGEFIGGVPPRTGAAVAGGGVVVAGLVMGGGVIPAGGAGLVVSKVMPPFEGGVTIGG